MRAPGTIVVGVDDTAGGRAALRHAVAAAARTGAAVEVVTAFPDPDLPPGVLGGAPLGRPGAIAQVLRESVRDHVAAVVEQVLADLPTPHPPVTVRAVAGRPVEVLLRAAAGGDLLVVGSHRGVGPVGRRCVRRAPCPVTVVHG